jgi:hypothetical protein
VCLRPAGVQFKTQSICNSRGGAGHKVGKFVRYLVVVVLRNHAQYHGVPAAAAGVVPGVDIPVLQ